MEIREFEKENININILFFTTISVSNYNTLLNVGLKDDLEISEEWWLSDVHNKEYYITIDNKMKVAKKPNEIKGVRVLCGFSSPDIKQGDKFIINNAIFKVLKPGVAISATVIGYSSYKRLSYVFNHWHIIAKSEKAFKVKYKNLPDINVADVGLLFPTDIIYSDIMFSTGWPSWTQNRMSEFEGRYIDVTGDVCTASIDKPLNICPLIHFTTSEFKAKATCRKSDVVESEGRLFRILSDQGIALCLNPVGISCYSTGIAPLGNKQEEDAFFRSSETYEIINKWYTETYLNANFIF